MTERDHKYGQHCVGDWTRAVSGWTRAVSDHGLCREVRQALAVYVLGAIEPAGRDVVQGHLADCAGCRDELAGLAALPALLRRVSLQEASALLDDGTTGCHPDDLPSGPALRLLLAQAGRHRRHHLRTRVAGAAAAGLLAGAGVIAGWHAAQPSAQGPAAAAPGWAVTPSAANPRTHVSATVRYAARPWGLQLSAQVTGIALGTTCHLEVISRQGQVTIAGGWTIASGPANWYPASSPVPASDVRGFAVSSGSRILVTVPVRAHAGNPAAPGAGWPW